MAPKDPIVLTSAQHDVANAEQRVSVAEQWLANTGSAVQAAESAYLAKQTDANYDAVSNAKRANERAELDLRAACTALHRARLVAWQAKQADIEARVAEAMEPENTFDAETASDLRDIAATLGEYWEIVQRIKARSERARIGVSKANTILRDEEFPHRLAHPDYVDPASLPEEPGVHYGTLDGKRPRETPKSFPVNVDPVNGVAHYIKTKVRAVVNTNVLYELKTFIP